MPMKLFKHGMLGLMLLCGASGLAMAEGEGGGNLPAFPVNGAVYITPSGGFTMKKLPEASVAMLLKEGATPLKAGVLIVMHDGKLFMVEDHKMSDGQSLAEMAYLRPAAGR